MLGAGVGLTEVRTEDLRHALRMLVRGELELPVHVAGLARVGLQHCGEPLLAGLRGLDAAGVRAVLVCVIAERTRPRRG